MSPVELAKKYPVATGVGAIVIFGAVLLFMNRGGAEDDGGGFAMVGAPPGASSDSAAFTYQLQAAGIAAATRLEEIASTERVETAKLATMETLAGYERDVSFNANELGAQVKLADITQGNETARLISTLQAQTAITQANYQLQAFNTQQATIQQQQNLAYQSMVAGYDAQKSIAQINSQTAIEQANIAARPKGLLSFLFG